MPPTAGNTITITMSSSPRVSLLQPSGAVETFYVGANAPLAFLGTDGKIPIALLPGGFVSAPLYDPGNWTDGPDGEDAPLYESGVWA